ncbi:hypothetical protein C4559_06415 [Candidatus Microgenomates bacterium]|nr:MAG: hypothetical protein C4559_06415 [Candidatus Microgenomates bacterium]
MALKSSQGKKGIGCLGIALIVIFVPILLLAGVIFFATSDLRRSDEDVLKTYQPTSEIVEIAEKNTLTDKGKATLYRSDPKLVDAQSFVKSCKTKARGIEPLGCIAPRPGGGPFGGRQIFLLQIDDPRFADHKYSAAIHEMLHSAYERLSSDEKKRINALLDQEFLKHQDDSYLKEVAERLKARKGSGIEGVQSELHSKFGVEYTELSPELEKYYKQYFVNRSKVVGLFEQGGFNTRIRIMDEVKYETEKLAPQLTSMQNQLTAYQNAGDQAGFNSLIGQYNSMVDQYNTKIRQSQRAYAEVKEFYQYFNPDYKPSEEKTQ